MGKYNKEEVERKELEKKKEEELEEQLVQKMKVNDRCMVRVPGQPERRGQVMFVGKKPLASIKYNFLFMT